jgi:hypothetical protein
MIDKVTTHSNPDMVWIVFLGSMINYNVGMHYCSIDRDKANFFVGQEEKGFSLFGVSLFTLGQAVDFLAHCRYPDNFQVRIML